MSKLICFSGFKMSGKDTCADYLIKNYNAVRVALADPLKDQVSQEYGVDRSSLDDPKRKELPLPNMPIIAKDKFTTMIAEFMVREFRTAQGFSPDPKYLRIQDGHYETFLNQWEQLYHTPRSLAILKGSTNRMVNPEYWTERAIGNIILREVTDPRLVVITDLRYKNEMQKFKDTFGDDVVFIRVKRHENSTSTDPSEMDLVDAKFDHYIDNTGSLTDTYGQLEGILKNK